MSGMKRHSQEEMEKMFPSQFREPIRLFLFLVFWIYHVFFVYVGMPLDTLFWIEMALFAIVLIWDLVYFFRNYITTPPTEELR